MTKKELHRDGAPCWVDTMQPDPRAACAFYGPLFGWDLVEPSRAQGDPLDGEQFIAHLRGERAAGIRQAIPGSGAARWVTYVGVNDLEPTLERVEAAGGSCLASPHRAYADERLAIVADPTGVRFGLLQDSDTSAARVVNEPGAWARSSLHTTDPDQAERFYGGVFGWQLESAPDAPFSRWCLDDHVVALLAATDGTSVPPHWSINFAVPDTDAITRHATRLGGTVLMPPFDTPGFRSSVLADPQGGMIAVSATMP